MFRALALSQMESGFAASQLFQKLTPSKKGERRIFQKGRERVSLVSYSVVSKMITLSRQ